MGIRQVACTEQKFPNNLAPGEEEGFLEQLLPIVRRSRMRSIEPIRERTILLGKLDDNFGVVDSRFDFQPVSDDSCILQEALPIFLVESCHARYIEISIGSFECLSFSQDCEPGETGLIDLQNEALE